MQCLARAAGALAFAMVIAASGCGNGDAPTSERSQGHPQAAAVPLTGDTIEVRMVSPGETYQPDEITARQGDVIRFVLVAGVHNVSFPADQNPAGVTLPEPGPYIQVPGMAHELIVSFPAGEYFFQCDPHAAMGMVGTLTVEP